MKYLVESHLGGYYISDLDPKQITAYCETCGDSDWIVLSWEEGQMMEKLTQYFSGLKYSVENIERDRQAGITKEEAIEDVLYKYSYDDRDIIKNLYEDRIISEEEYKILLKENLKSQKSQIALVCSIYPKEPRKILKKQKKNNDK